MDQLQKQQNCVSQIFKVKYNNDKISINNRWIFRTTIQRQEKIQNKECQLVPDSTIQSTNKDNSKISKLQQNCCPYVQLLYNIKIELCSKKFQKNCLGETKLVDTVVATESISLDRGWKDKCRGFLMVPLRLNNFFGTLHLILIEIKINTLSLLQPQIKIKDKESNSALKLYFIGNIQFNQEPILLQTETKSVLINNDSSISREEKYDVFFQYKISYQKQYQKLLEIFIRLNENAQTKQILNQSAKQQFLSFESINQSLRELRNIIVKKAFQTQYSIIQMLQFQPKQGSAVVFNWQNQMSQAVQFWSQYKSKPCKKIHCQCLKCLKKHQKIPIISFIKKLNTSCLIWSRSHLRPVDKCRISQKTTKERIILIILMHGFGGKPQDFFCLKPYLYLMNIRVQVVALKRLTNKMNNSLSQLGVLAANQIYSYYYSKSYTVYCINLIGFSLGGLVLRAALPHLSSIQHKLNVLLTICSPHLGLTRVQECRVSTVLKLMVNFGKYEIIKDLLLHQKQSVIIESATDLAKGQQQISDKQGKIVLEELASCPSLQYMKKIILVGAVDDQYVPSYSALNQYKENDQVLNRISKAFDNNLRNYTKELYSTKYQESILDMLTLRKRHMNLLCDHGFFEYLFQKYHDQFVWF